TRFSRDCSSDVCSSDLWQGVFGELDVAVVEVSGVTEEGRLIPSPSVGNNKTWLEQADRVILEVNAWQSEHLEGMHDVYYGTALRSEEHTSELQSRENLV